MPAQIYERSDVSGGTASEANPEANHRCEGCGSTVGWRAGKVSHARSAAPAQESERSEQRSERESSWGVGV